jgi:hypothetical protein
VRFLGAPHASISVLSILQKTMEKREVNRIYVAFVRLQIIAVMENFINVQMIGRRVKKLILRKQRSPPGPEISENHSACFLAGIGGVPDRIPMLAPARLSRLLQAAPRDIIEPTMVETSKPAVLNAPVTQVGSSMGAVNPQKPRSLLVVAEEHQIFGQNLYR